MVTLLVKNLFGFTFTILDAEAVHPEELDAVTEYDVVEMGETVMEVVEAPVLHE